MKRTKKRRTEITIETHSLTIVKIKKAETESVFCSVCGGDVRPVTSIHAALIFRVGEDFLAALAGSGQIHAAGENAFCPLSLAGYFKQEIRFIED